MFGDNDNFDKTTKKMVILAIAAAIINAGLIVLLIIGLLYLIKVWFFGGF